MRATSLPTALPVAAAAVALVAAALALLALPSTAQARRWLRPVPGEVARSFSYDRAAPFTAGAHRGADLAAPPGTAVRAACPGRIVHAGPVAGRDRVVSMSCDGRRVSYLPLATVAVEEDAVVRAGAPIGTVAPGHGGLHLGVRRESDRFGYQDPMPLLPPPERPFTPAPRPRPQPPPVARRPARPLPSTPRPAARPAIRPAPAWATAPWPVWAGLALLLCGAAGSGTVVVRRRRVREGATVRTPAAASAGAGSGRR